VTLVRLRPQVKLVPFHENPIHRPAAATVNHSAIDSAPTSFWRRAVFCTGSAMVTRHRTVKANSRQRYDFVCAGGNSR